MAKLTDTLDTINSGKRLVEPGPAGPSFLGGLARLAGNSVSAISQSTEVANKLQSRDALNETAGGIFNLQKEQAAAMRNVTPDPNIDAYYVDVPDWVTAQAKDLSKAQRGVEQGRVAQEAFQLKMESFIDQMYQKYPDQRHNIEVYMHDQGFDHYLFRDAKLQDQITQGVEKGTMLGTAAAVEAAQKNGLALPGMTQEQIIDRGQQFLHAQAEAELMSKSLEAAQKRSQLDRESFKFNQDQADRKVLSTAVSTADAYYGSVFDTVNNVATAAKTDADWAKVAELQPQIQAGYQTWSNHMEQRLAAQGMSKEGIEAFRETTKLRMEAMQDYFFGPSSRFQVQHRAFTQMQEQLSLSTTQALPVYSLVTRVIGQAGFQQLFSGDPNLGLNPELISKLSAELKAYDPTHPNQAINLLYQAGELIKGNKSLAEIPEAQITGDHMKILNATVAGNAQNIMDPEPDKPQEYNDYMNSLGNLSIQAIRLQPGTKNIDGISWGIGAIANGKNQAVLEKLMKDPIAKDRALPLMQETRAAAAQLLESGRTAVDKVPGQRVVWKNGQFVVEVTGKSTDGMIPLMDESGLSSLSMNRAPVVAPQLKKQVNALNAAVKYLTDTAKYDDSIPKSVTPIQLRDHYANGTPLPKPTTEGKSQTPGFDQSYDQLKQTIDKMSMDIQDKAPFMKPDQATLEPIAHAEADKLGVPRGIASYLFNQENGWRPDGGTQITGKDGKPASSARGIAQFVEKTAEQYGLYKKGEYDYRGDPTKAIPAGLQYLADLARKNGGDWIKALHQYGTLARSNFKSDEDYNRAVAAAQSALNEG